MKFTYQYKTSDGVRHSGVHAARSREAVYDELRAKGIKAFGVEPAPGFFNRLSGLLGWRLAAFVVLAVIAVVLLVAYLRESAQLREKEAEVPVVEESVYSWTILPVRT